MLKKIAVISLLGISTAFANNIQLQCSRSSDGINTHYRCQLIEKDKVLLNLADASKLYPILAKQAEPDCGAGTCRVTFDLQAKNIS